VEPTDVQAVQETLKAQYRADGTNALVTVRAAAGESSDPFAVSAQIAGSTSDVQAHPGIGGAGTEASSSDLLLGALAACAQVTCQMLAAAANIPIRTVAVRVEGDLDLRGALGLSPFARVGLSKLRIFFDIDAPDATRHQIDQLQRDTERYCVVLQTLQVPPPIEAYWSEPTTV